MYVHPASIVGHNYYLKHGYSSPHTVHTVHVLAICH